MASINSCVFWHRNAIFRDKSHTPNQVPIALTVIFKISMMTMRGRSVFGLACATCVPCFNRLPEDSIPTPKHVGVDSNNELYFMICTLLYFIECICWLVY
jgi:hypothetical protein